jgi:regulator of protease activity HflC (stomatin/prohibitin superfamily)
VNDTPGQHGDTGVPIEASPMEIEAPRRAASAQFNVMAEVGSQAALREAMDPANKSLAEALQLSFRVLQFGIIVLLVLFLFSGFKTIGNNESGIATIWGKVEDSQGLKPGLQMNWPPPIGDFVLVSTETRTQNDGRRFLASTQGAVNEGEAIQQATYEGLKPGRDYSVLVDGGELAHVMVDAQYVVEDVLSYVEHMEQGNAGTLVRLALQRAVVHVGATHTLLQLRETLSADEIRSMLKTSAQDTLDSVGSGLRIVDLGMVQKFEPPRYIQQSFEEYTVNLQLAQQEIQNAQKTKDHTLIRAAGEHWLEVVDLIETYEVQWELGDAAAADTMAKINNFFDGDLVAGNAYKAISRAKGHMADIDMTLGMEARRFEGLLEAYRLHPQLVIAERWMNARNTVMGQPDVETMYVPHDLGSMAIDLTGLQSVKDIRRKLAMQQREMNSMFEGLDMVGATMQRIDEIKQIGKAGRQLKVDSTTGRPKGFRDEKNP